MGRATIDGDSPVLIGCVVGISPAHQLHFGQLDDTASIVTIYFQSEILIEAMVADGESDGFDSVFGQCISRLIIDDHPLVGFLCPGLQYPVIRSPDRTISVVDRCQHILLEADRMVGLELNPGALRFYVCLPYRFGITVKQVFVEAAVDDFVEIDRVTGAVGCECGNKGICIVGVVDMVYDIALENQRHLNFVSAEVRGYIALVAEVVEGVVAHLAVGNLHGCVVDAVVAVIICFLGLIDADIVYADEGALILHGVGCETLRQVDDFAHLSVLEQRWVALAIHLLHFPAHWRQHQHVFASHAVWLYYHAFALHIGYCLVSFASWMGKCKLSCTLCRIQVVIYKPRRVVALQREHHRQVVAQIVAREVVVERQCSLVLAAHHAPGELHQRSVVEIGLWHLVGQHHAVRTLVVAFADKRVAGHHHLYGVAHATQHMEVGTPLEVRLYQRAGGVVHQSAVHHEAGTFHGDARAVIHHIGTEAHAVGDGELVYLPVIALGIECHAVRLALQTDVTL